MSRLLSSLILLFALLFTTAVPTRAQNTCPTDAKVEQGINALDAGQYQEAITTLRCVIEREPENPDAYIGRVEAYVLNGDWFLAFGDYRSASLYAKSSPPWWERMGTRISQLLDRDTSTSEGLRSWLAGHILQAHLHWYAGQDDNALREYDLILAKDPSNLFALTFRGSSRLYLGKAGYKEDWAKALELAPENPSVLYFIATSYRGTGDQDKALSYAMRLLEIAPESASTYHLRGRIYLAREEYQLAVADFDRAVELGLPPTSAIETLSFMGEAYLHLNRRDDALASFERAEKVLPGSPWIGFCVGYSYEVMGYSEQAASAYLDFASRLDAKRIRGAALKLNKPVTIALDHSAWNQYSFPVELEKGWIVQFTANSTDNSYTDPLIILLSPEGTAVAANDDQQSPHSLNAAIDDYVVPYYGLYTLIVTSSLDGSAGRVQVRYTVKEEKA